jgi:hypothetical protein
MFYGGSIAPATATCPQGEVALGGGWNVPPATARVFAATLSGNTWFVSAAPIGHTVSTTVTAYVECLRHAPGANVTTVSVPYTAPANSFSGGGVSCGSSGLLVGWGISFGATSALEMTSSLPELTGTWTMEFMNHGGTAVTGSLEAVCLKYGQSGSHREQSASVTVAVGATGANQHACTNGYATAGGYQSSSSGGGNIYLLHDSGGWADAGYAMTNTISFNVWALCVTFT